MVGSCVAVTATMRASSVRIDAVPELDIGAVVFGNDRLARVDKKFRRNFSMCLRLLVLDIKLFPIRYDVDSFKTIGSIDSRPPADDTRRSLGFDDLLNRFAWAAAYSKSSRIGLMIYSIPFSSSSHGFVLYHFESSRIQP